MPFTVYCWMSVVEEVGEWYGELLDGWWVYDAITSAQDLKT